MHGMPAVAEVNTARAAAEGLLLGEVGDLWYLSGSRLASRRTQSGPVAQLAEQQTLNLRVEGSIPSRLILAAW